MSIRIATRQDANLVLALVEELLQELGPEARDFLDLDRERLLASLEREQEFAEQAHSRDVHGEEVPWKRPPQNGGRFLALLARNASGAAIGILTLSSAFAVYAGGEYGIIQEMYVRPGARGQGVGGRLLAAVIAVARTREWLRLDVTGPTAAGMDAAAARVVRFYERHGFEPSGPKLRLLLRGSRAGETRFDQGGSSHG